MADTPVFVILPTRWTITGPNVPADGSRVVDGQVAINPAQIAAIVPDTTFGEGCTIYLAGGKAQHVNLPFQTVVEQLVQALRGGNWQWPDATTDVQPDDPGVRVSSIPTEETGEAEVFIDQLRYVVAPGTYYGAGVRRFAHPPIDDRRDLWHELPSSPDRLIEDNTVVDVVDGTTFCTTPVEVNGG